MTAALRVFWSWLRAWSGDSAYEAYLRRAGPVPLSREAFYLEALQRRYSTINRCC